MKTNTIYYELTASEFDWEVADEKIIRAWGFNQQLPGPVLKAKRGDTIVVKVKNELNEPTIVHWHGIRLPSSMDGTGDVQKPIKPGEEFEYRFLVPDAGTFWYHSHQNETMQMERGMYGALIVEEENDLVTDADRVLMIDDMKLSKNSGFRQGNFITKWMERHDGREGDTLLINGKEGSVIEMNAGQIERWRFINSSSARYFLLHLGGRPFRIIGTDGGLLESSKQVTEALITPGERLEILAGPFEDGETFFIESLRYDRTTFLRPKQQQFATVKVGKAATSVAAIPGRLRQIEALAVPDAEVTRKVTFSVEASWKHGIDFLVNGEMHSNDKPINIGELQVWEVSNTSLMDHPFHLHGFFFQVLQVNGKAPEFLAWKDTVNLPPKSVVKIAWRPDDRPGRWMYHCHILEHHEAGMMANFEVIDPRKGEQHHEQHHHHLH